MDNLLKSVYDLPDISFIENDSLDAMMQRLVSNYEKRYREVTGKTVSLGAADPVRVQLYAIALDLYQIEQFVDRAGKQDLLKYSYGGFLDNLAGTRGVTRHEASPARRRYMPARQHLAHTRKRARAFPCPIPWAGQPSKPARKRARFTWASSGGSAPGCQPLN